MQAERCCAHHVILYNTDALLRDIHDLLSQLLPLHIGRGRILQTMQIPLLVLYSCTLAAAEYVRGKRRTDLDSETL